MPNPLTAHFWHTLLGESMPQHKNGRTSSTGLKPVAPVRQNQVGSVKLDAFSGVVTLLGEGVKKVQET